MVPYVLPFVLYLGLTWAASDYPQHYAWLYPTIVALVGAVTFCLLRGRGLLRPHLRVLPGIAVGLVGIALWIAISHLDWDQRLQAFLPSWLRPGPRPGFNPFVSIEGDAARWSFVLMRFLGLVLVVPVVEELFWRGFLARWLLDPDWRKQPLGKFTPGTFAGVVLLFTLAHPEWIEAAIYCALLNLLIARTRDLWSCVVAHGVSNLVLGIYVVWTENWRLW